MTNEEFASRISSLRMQRGVSARDMSLSIGQNPGYINSIESGKSLPSMTVFFYICEYLHLTPKEFFDVEISEPQELNRLMTYAKKLNYRQLEHITSVVEDLTNP